MDMLRTFREAHGAHESPSAPSRWFGTENSFGTHRQLGNLLGKSKKFLVRRRRAAPAKGGAATGVSAPSSASWRPRMILVDGRDQIGAAACAPGWRSGCSVANASICMQAPRMRRAVG